MTNPSDDLEARLRAERAANDHCTCAEVYGEHPECVLHGIETEWALKNTFPEDWQTYAVEMRDLYQDAEAKRAEAVDTLASYRKALEQAAAWFDEYADHHAKLAEAAGYHVGEERNAKAERNRERAAFLRQALNPTRRMDDA